MMIIENKYEIGEMVFIVTDREQLPRQVTAIKITPGTILYQLACGTMVSDHYEVELSTEKNLEYA